jgi:hypothetical protein
MPYQIVFLFSKLTSFFILLNFEFRSTRMISQPIPVVSRSKEWVCGHSLAGIVGSNPTGGMDVRLSVVWCQVEVSPKS